MSSTRDAEVEGSGVQGCRTYMTSVSKVQKVSATYAGIQSNLNISEVDAKKPSLALDSSKTTP